MDTWNQQKTDYLRKQLSRNSCKTIVDLGCGPEAYTGVSIADLVETVICIDIFDDIDIHLKNLKYIKSTTHNRIPLDDNSVDALWASHLLEHVCNLGDFLTEIRRVLKPGGYIWVAVPPFKYEIVNHFTTGWSVGQLAYVLAGFGFDCSKVEFYEEGYNVFGGGAKNKLLHEAPTHFGEYCVSIEKVAAYLPHDIQEDLEKYDPDFEGCHRFEGRRHVIGDTLETTRPSPSYTKRIIRRFKALFKLRA